MGGDGVLLVRPAEEMDLRVGRWRSLKGDVDPRVVVGTQPHIIVVTFRQGKRHRVNAGDGQRSVYCDIVLPGVTSTQDTIPSCRKVSESLAYF